MTGTIRKANYVLQNSVFKNLSIVGLSYALSKFLGLIILGYPARILGPTNFGLVSFGSSIVAYASIFLLPGITTWGTREIARDRGKAGEVLVAVVFVRVILAIITYFLLLLYTFTCVVNSEERTIILLCGIAILSTSFSIDWVFNGLELMRIPAIVSALTSLVNVVGMVLLIHTPSDVYKYALFYPTIIFLNVVGCYLFLKKRNIQFKFVQVSYLFESLKAALPLGLMMSLVVILHFANNFIVKFYLGSSALGIFMAAFNLFELATAVPIILGTVFSARLTRISKEAQHLVKREANIFAKVHMIMAFFIASFFFSESSEIIGIIYGGQYFLAEELLRYLSIAVIFNFAIFGYTNCLISLGYDRAMILVVIVSAIVSVIGGLILVPRLGLLGAVIAIILIDFFGWMISIPYYKTVIGTINLRIWIKPVFGSLMVISLSMFFQRSGLPLEIRIPVCIVAYFSVFFKDIYNIFFELKRQ